ncbi:MAG TPA: hypothetical protein VFC15_07330 [Candidatus Limnocylindrales bacterium]|nr:hypothetical protein [Candidatus Limnocylindrales bacterium]
MGALATSPDSSHSWGLALGMTAALVYMPFAQRSLVLMYARNR